jgi:predicted phage tail protein
MLSRYDINALDVPGIVLAGSYALTEELVSLEMLSKYDINALDVPRIVLAGLYNLTEELLNSEMMSRYDIISKEVRKEMDSSYDITKTPAQITGERTHVDAQSIDNYWNPWNDEDLSYYKVHRSLINGFAPSDANLVGVPSTNTFKHINLAAVTQYYFKVCAVTKLGVSGTYSAQFTATTA